MLTPTDFFNLDDPIAAKIFGDAHYVWEPLASLAQFVDQLTGGTQTLDGEIMAGAHLSDRPIFLAPGARIEPGAYLEGPAYIGRGAVVRHGAFVRENVIMLANSILGHASEAKNSLFLQNAHAPHFNYVGDSILGQNVNLGAGTKLSNLTMLSEKDKLTGKRPTIKLQVEGQEFDTGLAKLGAILGDGSQTGCNTVLNPGSLVGPDCLIYANLSLRRGYHPPNSVIKLRQKTSTVPRSRLR